MKIKLDWKTWIIIFQGIVILILAINCWLLLDSLRTIRAGVTYLDLLYIELNLSLAGSLMFILTLIQFAIMWYKILDG